MSTNIAIVSEETKRRLVRYALAVQRYERENRRIDFRDGSFSFAGPTGPTIIEHSAAKEDLKNCPEPEIRALVYQIYI